MKDPEWMRDKLHALAIEADEMLGSCDASDILDTLEVSRNVMTQGAETIARLMVELEQAKLERDAAVEQLRGKCFACAKAKRVEIGAGNMYTCEELRIGGYRSACPAWEWRGVQENAQD